MRSIKKNIIVTILFLTFPIVVYADCTSDFKAVEKDFKESYKYNADTDDFTIILVNPDYEKYTFGFHNKDEIKNVEMKYNGKQVTVTVKNYKGTKYDYVFVARYNECMNQAAKSGSIELKKYNPYADHELCKGNEDFVLCQRDYDKAIDEETFKSRLETYTKTKENESTTNDIVDNNENNNGNNKATIFDNILNYIHENTVEAIIIATFTVVLIAGLIIYTMKSIKSRRLE